MWRRDGCCARDLHQGRAAAVLSFAEISAVFTQQFPIIVAWVCFVFLLSFVDVGTRPHLPASKALVRLLTNISIQWVGSSSVRTRQPFVNVSLLLPFFQTPKSALLHVDCPWCVLQCSNRHNAALTRQKWTAELHSQRVTVWPWITAWKGLSTITNNETKIVRYRG
jgi:hypothetical protein